MDCQSAPVNRVRKLWGGRDAALRFMSADTVYTRTFRRAMETLGDAERLSEAVGASVAEIEAWAAGHAHPPTSAFLKAIDVVARELVSPRAAEILSLKDACHALRR